MYIRCFVTPAIAWGCSWDCASELQVPGPDIGHPAYSVHCLLTHRAVNMQYLLSALRLGYHRLDIGSVRSYHMGAAGSVPERPWQLHQTHRASRIKF